MRRDFLQTLVCKCRHNWSGHKVKWSFPTVNIQENYPLRICLLYREKKTITKRKRKRIFCCHKLCLFLSLSFQEGDTTSLGSLYYIRSSHDPTRSILHTRRVSGRRRPEPQHQRHTWSVGHGRLVVTVPQSLNQSIHIRTSQ